jgi:hypothetical protein
MAGPPAGVSPPAELSLGRLLEFRRRAQAGPPLNSGEPEYKLAWLLL